jgi:hypothetical protein
MNTLIIEPSNKVDYQLFLSLAKRLNVRFREEKVIPNKKELEEKEKEFLSLFGSFEDIDSEEMIKEIESSRTTKDIDISWVE